MQYNELASGVTWSTFEAILLTRRLGPETERGKNRGRQR